VAHGREFWRALSREVDEGGGIADVARRHRVRPRTLSWWRWKLASEGRREPLLLPVVVSSPRAATESAFIELHVGDVMLRVVSGTDERYIAALVAALRA
jgi:transposase-like protein